MLWPCFLFALQIEGRWRPCVSTSIRDTFLMFAHLVSVCHILIILSIFQASHDYICYSNLWPVTFGVRRAMPTQGVNKPTE